MLKLLNLFLLFTFLIGCSEKAYVPEENLHKTEVKKEEKKPIIKFSNPFTDDVDIEDILGR